MNKIKILLGLAFFYGFLFAGPVSAQTGDVTNTTATPVVASTENQAQETIGSWKLFWQGVKEQLSLLVAVDPVVKAEKLTEFAKQRMEMADALAIQAKDNPKLQKRAEQMMEKAVEFMQKIDDKKEVIAAKQTERAKQALQRAAEQSLKRQEIINRLEQRLTPESMQKLEELRTRGLENSQRLINAIGNENISTTTKARLEDIKARIEAHLAETKAFVQEKKDLLEKAQSGDTEAIDQLKKLRQERLKNMEERRLQTEKLMQEKKENRNQIRNEVREVRRENKPNSSTKPMICTQEAKICPNGSSVGRTGPNCEFAACPAAALQ